MAKEQNVSVNLSSVSKEPYGAPSGGSNSALVSSPAAMPVEPEEEREAASAPSSTGCSGVGTSMDPEELPEEGAEASKSPSVKSKSPPDSTSSSSPESDLEVVGLQHQGTYKTKDFPVPLSPPDRVMGVKRRLWDVDRREVDESLSRELKRIRQEESLVKSSKYNYDFEKDVPLSGPWVWEKAKSPPEFYKTKDCPKKKTQSRYSPYDRSGTFSQPVSSSDLPQTSSASLVTSSRELKTLRSAVTSSTVPSPETSTKECVRSSEDPSSVLFEDIDVIHGSRALTESCSAISRTTPSTTTTTTTSSTSVNPDIYSPDYFKPPVPVIQCSHMEDIPKTSSIVSSSTSITSSSSNVGNNGSICISSSSISSDTKNITETCKSTGSSNSSTDTSNENGSNKNTASSTSSIADLEGSCSSGQDISKAVSCGVSGIVPERFYSSEASEITEREELNVDSSSTTKSSSSTNKKEKRKLKTSKPSSSDDSSPSPLLKYYR